VQGVGLVPYLSRLSRRCEARRCDPRRSGAHGAETMSTTTRHRCDQCDPDGKRSKSKARTVDERGIREYCHRCQQSYCESATTSHQVREVPSPSPDKLARIWDQLAQPFRGTVGQTYLEHRHCVLPPDDGDLRFLPSKITDQLSWPPSLVALVTDAVTNEPMTLHFTPLQPNGRGRLERRLLAGHPKKGGVIRLWPDSDVRYGLGIAEGIETALSAAHAYTPVWATVDAGNMAVFPVLDAIQTLMVFADNDAAGLAAARACGSRWASAGREARLVIPEQGDINDAVAA
jgi:putative DNA primase/helicase